MKWVYSENEIVFRVNDGTIRTNRINLTSLTSLEVVLQFWLFVIYPDPVHSTKDVEQL